MGTQKTQARLRTVMDLTVNGQTYTTSVRPYDVLLDVIRENLNLVGTRRGCDMGTCGCCTVIVDGRAVLSCLTLALPSQGKAITTVEGIKDGSKPHPVQRAYVEKGGSQCGFCTSGFVMTTKAFLDRVPNPQLEQIKQEVAGNLCRCTGYIKIYESVQYAAELLAVARGSAPGAGARSEGEEKGKKTEAPA